jgi:2-hydroxy-3-keto-5-methylthiopentenyl-1-phosphate phosphatase
MRLVLDWDGTCTISDSLVDAIRRFGDESVFHAGHSSYAESLAAEVGSIRADAATVSAWAAEHVQIRAGLHELVERYSPVIVSSGLPQLIAPVLAREGLELEVRSNDADPAPDGWRLRFRDVGPCPVCGDMCKRRSLPEGRPLVYAGDGVSDRCAARAADRVFARGWLAAELQREGIPHERFETLDDIAAALS